MAKGMEFPSAPSSENTEALEAAREKTRGALEKWKSRNARLLASMAALGTLSVFEAPDVREGVKEAAELWSPDLQELDPEMTRERFLAVMGTVPDGFVEKRVWTIAYQDEARPMGGEYGLAGWETLAEAGDAGDGEDAPTLITFYRDARDESSRTIWGDTVLHEIAHANDWDDDPTMSRKERDAFRKTIEARLDAPDRFVSKYVEKIDNPDEKKERDRKATEYWAEIFSAYLRGETMSPDDEALVAAVIRRKDPDFDRDAALKKRNETVEEMAREEGEAEDPSNWPSLTSIAGWETNPDL